MKIGVITHYYKSENYGGNLQAYALVRYLKGCGYDAEQISYLMRDSSSEATRTRRGLKFYLRKDLLALVLRRVVFRIEEKRENVTARHHAAFEKFNLGMIPHSATIWRNSDIAACAQDYDVFITGSDQVWNFAWYHSAFFLEFVPDSKPKLSYAASIAMRSLTEKQKEKIRKSLKGFQAISVREEDAIACIRSAFPSDPPTVTTVLDPVLLLSPQEWDEVATRRVVQEPYVFAYFLGNDRGLRRLASSFAKAKGLKLVTLPYMLNGNALADIGVGDVRLFDATPPDFVSLIRDADYVLTDSFHAVAFSELYRTQYFVFNRNKKDCMNSRIRDITALFGHEERFCQDKTMRKKKALLTVPDVEYGEYSAAFCARRTASVDFLQKNLKG